MHTRYILAFILTREKLSTHNYFKCFEVIKPVSLVLFTVCVILIFFV